MIVLEDNRLVFFFPDVHPGARCTVDFQRTLRIPDDGRDYPLPPGLGRFPLRHLDDYTAHLPQSWRDRGGVMAPMHQAEALWISFKADYPFAVKVGTGKVCAITGDAWVDRLNQDPQDYAALPEQPWLDGYCVEKGVVRQFVAMPLGEGFTVEEQLTGAAAHGGVQLVAYPMKAARYETRRSALVLDRVTSCVGTLGLAPGGRMKQEICEDPDGLDAWNQRRASRCFVSLLNTTQWLAVTGERPPTQPPTARCYADHGLPWFDYYGGDARAIAGSGKLRGLRSVAEQAAKKGQALPANETVEPLSVIPLGKPGRVLESGSPP